MEDLIINFSYQYNRLSDSIIEKLMGYSDITACWLHSELKEMAYIFKTKEEFDTAIRKIKMCTELNSIINLKVVANKELIK
ncbi:MAG: hypothetical protein WC783_00550 [Candidatus Paceibacterota bacterium]|jgi:hypothetical protein